MNNDNDSFNPILFRVSGVADFIWGEGAKNALPLHFLN